MKGLERILNIALVLAAVTIAGSMARREIMRPVTREVTVPDPVFHPNWRQLLDSGRLSSGHQRSAVQIIEFLDLECSACRTYQTGTLASLKRSYGDSIAVTTIHLPLSIHRFAVPAAYASECAARQGRFAVFVDVALAKQDSFGIKPWSAFALESGVRDVAGFSACVEKRDAPLVQAGQSLAARLEIKGTPTFIVNGWQYTRPPTEKVLREEIDAILAGRPRPIESSKVTVAPDHR